ncbi:MAG: hypothetical protein ACM3L6_04870 [Deltaproteobacteria bacterium]
MRPKNAIGGALLFAALLWFAPRLYAADAQGFVWRWMPVGLQVSTTVSDGSFTMEEVFDTAHEAGLEALIIMDRDTMRWEYGLWPLQHLLKRSESEKSVSSYGYSNYLHDISFYSRKYPDLIIIPGVEAAPFYYWTGSLFSGSLRLNNWHRHILVAGLTDAEDLRHLPNVARPSTIARSWRWVDIFRLFPFVLLGAGAFLFYRREYDYADEKGVVCSRFSLRWRLTGIGAACLGLLFIINENPFLPQGYDQYSRTAGYRPYQDFIDYVRGEGGLTFWAHPEAANSGEHDGVRYETLAHPGAIMETKDYTGFCVFPEGLKIVGAPGGQWDRALMEYCRGERAAPVWAVSGMSFDTGSRQELLRRMEGTRTYVLGEALNWHDILDAMRGGRMYATAGGADDPLLLHEFSVMDSSTGQRVGPGSIAVISGSPIVAVTADRKGSQEEQAAQEPEVPRRPDTGPKDIKVSVIRNGEVVKEEDHALPLGFFYVDPQPLKKASFYRVVITRGPQTIVTNPIFAIPKVTAEKTGKDTKG